MAELQWANFLVALGIGLLVGIERERRKGEGSDRAAAGLRTFSVAALLGAAAAYVDSSLLLVVLASLALLCAASVARHRGDDPGLTTEIALLLTALLGGMAMTEAALAAGLGVALAVLLAARNRLHHFVKTVITERELHDGLILLAASLVILPLMPDRYLGPFAAINPRNVWQVAVMVLLAGAFGHVASRLLDVRLGLPAAGFASGFASSTATVAAMGGRVRRDPQCLAVAASAAIASSVATFAQLGLVLAVANRMVLDAMAWPLAGAALATAGYVVISVYSQKSQAAAAKHHDADGSAISIATALVLAGVLVGTMLLSAALEAVLGRPGALAAAVLSGLGDVHAAAAAAASLVTSARLDADGGAVAVLGAITANTLVKAVVAGAAGGRRYALAVLPGLVLGPAVAWSCWLLA